jgi:hypothetical protein
MNASTPPLVSIITPAFNSARHIAATLECVQAQDYRPLEHIVIDGGSTDGTLDVLRGAGDHVRWVSEPDGGQADALNKGLRLARGEILGWINADDAYAPGAVRAAVERLQAEPAIGLVFADCQFIDDAGGVVGRWQTRPTTVEDLLLEGCTIAHQSAFMRRSAAKAAGEFDAALRYVMDYDFLLRVRASAPAERVEAVWGSLRVWAGTKTHQNQADFWPETFAVIERLARRRPVPEAVRAEAGRRAHWRYGLALAWAEDYARAAQELALAARGGFAYGSAAELAERTVSRCERPSYLPAEPAEAEVLLDRVLKVPGLDARLAAQLHAVRAFRAARRAHWRGAGRHARSALSLSRELRRNRGLWALWARSLLRAGG